MQFSFFLFCVYMGVSLLSLMMHNLWYVCDHYTYICMGFLLKLCIIILAKYLDFNEVLQGTRSANFYFITAIAFSCFQVSVQLIIRLLTYYYSVSWYLNRNMSTPLLFPQSPIFWKILCFTMWIVRNNSYNF